VDGADVHGRGYLLVGWEGRRVRGKGEGWRGGRGEGEGRARGGRGEGEGRARGGRERGANGEGLKGDLESVRVRSEEEMSNRGPNLLSSLGICSLRMATGRHNQEPKHPRQRSGIFSLCRMTSTIVSTPHFPPFSLFLHLTKRRSLHHPPPVSKGDETALPWR